MPNVNNLTGTHAEEESKIDTNSSANNSRPTTE